MTKQEMMEIVYSQLAIDYNCRPEDFNKDGVMFTIAEKQEGRREMPFITHRLEIITMGKSAIVNVSKNMMSFAKRKFEGKSNYDILTSKFVYGVNPYYLPDIENIKTIENNSFRFKLIYDNIQLLYSNKDFHNALQYDADSKRPEVLAAVAYDEEKIVGIACASDDSKTMSQIGVDVLPEYRGNGIAVKLVNMLTIETLDRSIVPYYTTDCANINSQKVAFKSGYIPAWSHCFKTRLPKIYRRLND